MRGLFFTVGFLVAMSLSGAAQANDPKLISTHGDWSVFTFDEDGSKVCFTASQPTSSKGNYKRRGDAFALITHRPAENSYDVVSIVAGYTYKTGSSVKSTANGRTFEMFTQGDTAWANDDASDRALAKALQRGSKLVVKGTSSRGTDTTDTYSLKGATAAYKAMSRACNVRR